MLAQPLLAPVVSASLVYREAAPAPFGGSSAGTSITICAIGRSPYTRLVEPCVVDSEVGLEGLPWVSTTSPPPPAIALRRTRSCSASTFAYSCAPNRLNSCVEPSTSVNKNVTAIGTSAPETGGSTSPDLVSLVTIRRVTDAGGAHAVPGYSAAADLGLAQRTLDFWIGFETLSPVCRSPASCAAKPPHEPTDTRKVICAIRPFSSLGAA